MFKIVNNIRSHFASSSPLGSSHFGSKLPDWASKASRPIALHEMFCLFLVANCLQCLLPLVRGDFDNFPVKSKLMADAYNIDRYETFDAENVLVVPDAHPVHGIWTDDGHYVYVGKGLDSEGSSDNEAFAVKIRGTAPYDKIWVWKSGISGSDGANAVVQMPGSDGSKLIVVGYAVIGGIVKRTIWRLSLSDGVQDWMATDFGDTSASGGNGGLETVEVSFSSDGNVKAGDGIVTCGFINKADASELSFKSYGNVPDGQAVVMKVPLSALTQASAPTSSDLTWSKTFPSYTTCKSIKAVRTTDGSTTLSQYGDMVALLYHETSPKTASLIRLDVSGNTVWGPTDYGNHHGEGTDIALTPDAAFVGISGHGDNGEADRFFAALTKVNTVDGALMFSGFYNGGDANSQFIKNECWGIQYLKDAAASGVTGFVLGCGTGIENCNGMTGSLKTACDANQPVAADSRANAVPRKSSVWQSLIIRTDDNGVLKWQRVDQFRSSGDPALGQSGWEEVSSACEYLIIPGFTTSGSDPSTTVGNPGQLAAVNDEGVGVGFVALTASSSGNNGGSNNNGGGSNNGGGNNNGGGSNNGGGNNNGGDSSQGHKMAHRTCFVTLAVGLMVSVLL